MKTKCQHHLLYADVISLFATRKCQTIPKIDKNSYRKSLYLENDLRNFNEVFKKDVPYDIIKSHKKTGLYLLSRKYSFGKTTGVG